MPGGFSRQPTFFEEKETSIIVRNRWSIGIVVLSFIVAVAAAGAAIRPTAAKPLLQDATSTTTETSTETSTAVETSTETSTAVQTPTEATATETPTAIMTP